MRFSERMGFQAPRSILQINSMDDPLRHSLWNVIYQEVFSKGDFYSRKYRTPPIEEFCKILWFDYYKMPIDKIPGDNNLKLAQIRSYFFSCEWYQVYDFVEFTTKIIQANEKLIRLLNFSLTQEMSAYRIFNMQFVPITSEVEIASVEEALQNVGYDSVKAHLNQALTYLATKPIPDSRNSIKESISAVESLCRHLTKNSKATLGDALSELEKKNIIHPALKRAFSSLYGYTSDAEGVRHSMVEDSNISSDEARFFLVSCSAFCNYVKSQELKHP